MAEKPTYEELEQRVKELEKESIEHKQAKVALREREEKYRLLFESMSEAFALHEIITDKLGRPYDFRFLEINSAYELLTGLRRAEVIGRCVREVTTEPPWIKRYGKVALTGKPDHFQEYSTTLERWFEVFAYQPRPGQCAAILTDITMRKRTEEALHHALEKFEKTFQAAPIWVVLSYLEDGRYMEVNEIFLKTMGYKREEVIGKTSLELNTWVNPLDRERIVAQVKKMAGIHLTEVQRRTRSGAIIDTLFSAETLSLEGKQVMISVSQEITEQKKTEAEREELQAQLHQAQKMESVGRLAGGVAHDFNNMLGVILGRAELMFRGMEAEDPHYEDLQEIYKATRRSVDLTRQLLTFARKQAIAPKVLDLNDTVEGMLKMLRRLIGEDIDLVWKPDTQFWPVKVDPAQVDQILANLCVNARDAIDGTGKVTIETETVTLDKTYCSTHAGFEPGQYVMLAVSDDGRGIDKETLENLFEPFFTTKEVGEGTGLGLATVYGIVKQNNGFINVYSEPGQGTTFKIYLPRTWEAGEAKGKSIAKTIPTGSETVLMVEDEASILRLGKTVLEQFGYKVLAAHTPRQALVTAEQYEGPIHLLVTDVVMPEMNGKELVERIEKLRPHIKVLFMSGYTANIIVHRGITQDNVDFLPKPFTINSLGAKVREVLGRQE